MHDNLSCLFVMLLVLLKQAILKTMWSYYKRWIIVIYSKLMNFIWHFKSILKDKKISIVYCNNVLYIAHLRRVRLMMSSLIDIMTNGQTDRQTDTWCSKTLINKIFQLRLILSLNSISLFIEVQITLHLKIKY